MSSYRDSTHQKQPSDGLDSSSAPDWPGLISESVQQGIQHPLHSCRGEVFPERRGRQRRTWAKLHKFSTNLRDVEVMCCTRRINVSNFWLFCLSKDLLRELQVQKCSCWQPVGQSHYSWRQGTHQRKEVHKRSQNHQQTKMYRFLPIFYMLVFMRLFWHPSFHNHRPPELHDWVHGKHLHTHPARLGQVGKSRRQRKRAVWTQVGTTMHHIMPSCYQSAPPTTCIYSDL